MVNIILEVRASLEAYLLSEL